MSGFRNIKQWADAATDDGKNWISVFRKVPPSAATVAGQWFDYSTAVGTPVPNYYASAPLIASRLESDKGIYCPSVAPDKQFIRRLVMMTVAASVTATSNNNQTLWMLDYLLYYPFIDLDAAGEDQILNNAVTLPRYTDGRGVKMMMVAQSPTNGSGSLTVSYTNQDGVSGRTSSIYCAAAQPSGALVSSIATVAGVSPFLPLQSGDTGVRSVESVTVTSANGGLAAIVLVMPLQDSYVREGCRRPTSSPTESYGDATEIERIRTQPGSKQIQDGAFLSFIGRHQAGSIASAPLVGILETVWS